ncbi:MAG: 4Fe-4S dicluster domain-containing protein [Planctomycetota bacterium]|nr:MAG: 4Fe-4S dicluster domain-containing protein [Planctomycetota bacterium]
MEYDGEPTLGSLLLKIQENPINRNGEPTSPVAWGGSCLENLCGGCAIQVNGTYKMACNALVKEFKEPILIEPLEKFPVIRDLLIDLTSLQKDIRYFKPWKKLDGYSSLNHFPELDPNLWEEIYPLSLCHQCGICLEACPQVNKRSPFKGAAPLTEAFLIQKKEKLKKRKMDRTLKILGKGGIGYCDFVGNCETACPRHLPLARAMAKISQESTRSYIHHFFYES